jgi:transcriptional regulator with XRE-family HTH domain
MGDSLTNIDATINKRITEVREKLGFSQIEFARGVNIGKSLLSSLESAQRRVTDRLIRLISLTYGVNERWLKTGHGEMFDNFEDIRLRRVTENFKKLDAFLQEYILKQMDFVLEIQGKLDGRDEEEKGTTNADSTEL